MKLNVKREWKREKVFEKEKEPKNKNKKYKRH